MIYVDTSVALGHLLAEDRSPPDTLWSASLVSSPLLEYELWTRINARGLHASHGEALRALLNRLALLELAPRVLARALEHFLHRFARLTQYIFRQSSSCAVSG